MPHRGYHFVEIIVSCFIAASGVTTTTIWVAPDGAILLVVRFVTKR